MPPAHLTVDQVTVREPVPSCFNIKIKDLPLVAVGMVIVALPVSVMICTVPLVRAKVIAAQAIIDRSVEQLYQDNLTSDDINKLGNAIHKAIQTINLVEGKSTAINESRSKDGSDLAIMDLLNEAKMRNEIVKDQLANVDQIK